MSVEHATQHEATSPNHRLEGPRQPLAARQRQPEQAGVADRALARRGAGDRRGQVGRADVAVRSDQMDSTTNINSPPDEIAGTAGQHESPTKQRATKRSPAAS